MKKFLKNIAQSLGYDILHIPTDPIVRRQMDLMSKYDIDIVFDIGANIGQYGTRLRSWGYTGDIVSFEPLPNAYKELVAVSANDDAWKTKNCALGNYIGETNINVSKNSYSSSILDILPAHISSAPDSIYVDQEFVKILTVDSIINSYVMMNMNLFIKIDTQGYERNVFEGCMKSLDKIKGFQMELSLIPLYEGETLLYDMVNLMKEYEYTLRLIETGHVDYDTGEMLQAECYFYKNDAS